MTRGGDSLLLVTGATGLVGSHVVDRALHERFRVRALVRRPAECGDFLARGVELIEGSMTDANALDRCVPDVTHVVHCAAKVGDWGPVEGYREVNVSAFKALLGRFRNSPTLRRFVHVSSLGVYPARDHWGTDETTPPSTEGIDGYTLSKLEAEHVAIAAARELRMPVMIVRPGFIYGPRDRSVLPRLLERLRSGQFAYLGDRTKLMNNTYVGNLVDAIFQLLFRDVNSGEVFNITDGRLVTKEEFVGTVAELAGLPEPRRTVPLGVAKVLAAVLETVWRWRCKTAAPLLSRARIKFLGLNLDFSIDKARRLLAYNPRYDFQDGIAETMAWFRNQGLS